MISYTASAAASSDKFSSTSILLAYYKIGQFCLSVVSSTLTGDCSTLSTYCSMLLACDSWNSSVVYWASIMSDSCSGSSTLSLSPSSGGYVLTSTCCYSSLSSKATYCYSSSPLKTRDLAWESVSKSLTSSFGSWVSTFFDECWSSLRVSEWHVYASSSSYFALNCSVSLRSVCYPLRSS